MRWEHTTVTCSAADVSVAVSEAKNKLDEFGKEGWELVGVTSDRVSPEKASVTAFLKRKTQASVKRLLLSRADFPGMMVRGGLGDAGMKLHAVTSFGLVSGEFANDQESDSSLGLGALEKGLEGAFAETEDFKGLALDKDLVPLKNVTIRAGGAVFKFNGFWLDPEMVIGFLFGKEQEP